MQLLKLATHWLSPKEVFLVFFFINIYITINQSTQIQVLSSLQPDDSVESRDFAHIEHVITAALPG